MADKKTALITGVTGQMGSYLAEFLIGRGDYNVIGMIRRTSSVDARKRIEYIPELKLEYGDMSDSRSVDGIVREHKPDEIYNLAAQSHVWVSNKMRTYTADVDGIGVLRICEAAQILHEDKPVRVFQASTSELFGGIYKDPITERTPHYPRSPYATAKEFGFWTMKNFREGHDMFCSNGILFNTESPRRGENFVTRKITLGIADILKGKSDRIRLGNLNAKRDWNHAKDTVRAVWSILQAPKPGDYIVSSGTARSIREFAEKAFSCAGINLAWRGEGMAEEGFDMASGKTLISVDKTYFRPAEVDVLLGDSTKIRTELGWKPEISFDELVKDMVDSDLKSK